MQPTNDKILWLRGGARDIGYYEPTIDGNQDGIYNLRPTFWTWGNDLRLGVITDTNQPDQNDPLSGIRFIEFKDQASGELRYVKYNVDSFDTKYEVREPEASPLSTGISFLRKYRTQMIVAAIGILIISQWKKIAKWFKKQKI